MKITISFEKEEKEAFIDAVSSIQDSVVENKDQHYAGKFGEYKYDTESNEFVLDLKTDFVKDSIKLFVNYFNIIKAFAENYMTFLVSWFDDVKDMNEDSEESSDLTE